MDEKDFVRLESKVDKIHTAIIGEPSLGTTGVIPRLENLENNHRTLKNDFDSFVEEDKNTKSKKKALVIGASIGGGAVAGAVGATSPTWLKAVGVFIMSLLK